MPYDAVWFTPPNESTALDVIGRVPRDECVRRRCRPLTCWLDSAPMPTGGKTRTGTCIVTNFIGSPSLPVGNVDRMRDLFDLNEPADGLVVGTWRNREAFLLSPACQRARTSQETSEASERERARERHMRDSLGSALGHASVILSICERPWWRRLFGLGLVLEHAVLLSASLADAMSDPPPMDEEHNPLPRCRAALASSGQRVERKAAPLIRGRG